MILDNVKERLNAVSEELKFIKECLWPWKLWKRTREVKRWTIKRRFLSWSKEGFRGWEKDKTLWRENRIN